METGALIQHIREFCLENANADNSVKHKKYFKEAPDNYGLTQPQMNEKAKQLLKEKSVTLNTAINAVPQILKAGKYEEITIVLLLVNGFEKQFTKTLFFEIAEWFSLGINNWAHADTLGMFILPKFFKHKILEDSDFNIWMNSPYKFQRRCIPVTFIKTLKTRTDFKSVFTFLEPLILDPDREVHQGMGWFLRECWKKKPAETESFLLKWKDKSPRLIIQYATEKMTKEEKLKFRKSK